MPEGHSVHRIARQFRRNFVGQICRVSSPQGRFAQGAAQLDGLRMVEAKAVGKQMFLEFESDRWLRVHLGIYGAWDFAGEILVDDTIASAAGRMGQTNQAGTVAGAAADRGGVPLTPAGGDAADSAAEDSVSSIGAPRRSRVSGASVTIARMRMAEYDTVSQSEVAFPPPPVGAVRVRILTEKTVADLRGPTVCELATPAEIQAVIDRLGPDPENDSSQGAERTFIERVSKTSRPIGAVLMDQAVVSGIGNVYRAEILFRAGINPHTPAKNLTHEQLHDLWVDWVHLLSVGVRLGQMMTMDDLDPESYTLAMANRDDRHWVYKREGLPCRRCGTNIVLEEMATRKLYWCVECQK
ncbi:DNA glycosylase [Lysinibacter sp. HNR]|uniref:Fpg/Nei family DNA glycosylase n=1 Tax=Lysinibacter sp. HNR TaxID=3031408 RepID=UPI00243605C8|nr:DNA glycosylase [Lysinibacter sp. HNR]WGD36423.1 DNA-formamidopyrimidine glycosylase family protein [Lysinibacter sp. HNR]